MPPPTPTSSSPLPPGPAASTSRHVSPAPPSRRADDEAPRKRERQVVGDYVVLKTLGTGSFGRVKLAEHRITGCKVALKFINRKKVATPEMTERVTREIEYLRRLQHPHIIKLYEVISTPESIVMSIEYLTGELFDYIVKTGKMPEGHARWFFQQILAAVEYCHSNGIVHRDLKPEKHVSFNSQRNIKIADFGLSNVIRDGDFLKTSCGSPNYAAPEVISGKLYGGPEIDIWSCGVILYVMLCGRLPFDDDCIPLLFKKIQNGTYAIPPYLSADARYLIQRMLAVDSNKRAKIPEIRQMAWFQKHLPDYLAYPPVSETANAEGGDGKAEDEEAPMPTSLNGVPIDDASKPGGRQWVGKPRNAWIEYDAIEDLCERSHGMYEREQVLASLLDTTSDPNEEKSKQLWVSYQLVADARRVSQQSVSASGMPIGLPPILPPPGVLRATSVRKAKKVEAPLDDDDEPVPEVDSQIKILSSSLHPSMVGQLSARGISHSSSRHGVSPLHAGRDLTLTEVIIDGMPVNDRPAIVAPAPNGKPSKRPKARWHFGIRSRSPPMEVMLEIYKTLKILGFDWRARPADATTTEPAAPSQASAVSSASSESGSVASETPSSSERKKARKDEEERVKKAQELFLVETRCKLEDVEVRMDIQLYQIDEENYLVDFRNLGYRLQPAPVKGKAAIDPALGLNPLSPIVGDTPGPPFDRERGRAGSMSTVADESESGEPVPVEEIRKVYQQPGGGTGVASPFLFLDTACKLIVSLAAGGS